MAPLQSFVRLIQTTWRRGKTGKAAIGCAGLLLFCGLCAVCVSLYGLTPQSQQNASATARARGLGSITETAAAPVPTQPPRPSRTARPSATPRATDSPDLPSPTSVPVRVSPTVFARVSPTAPAPVGQCPDGCAVMTPPAGCVIKGNVSPSANTKIYHRPGDRDYNRTNIRPSEGDRWFCTDAEAEASGFRRAQR